MKSWHNEHADGSKSYPLWSEALGTICYTDVGFVYVHVMAVKCAPYAMNDPFNGSTAEDSAAVKSHISYCETNEKNGAQDRHDVTISSCPNWAGTAQLRSSHLEGDVLELTAAGAMFQGDKVTARLIWKRAGRR